MSDTDGPCALHAHPVRLQEITFNIDRRFEEIELIAYGRTGATVAARDSVTGHMLAIYGPERVFESAHSIKRLLRKVKILRLAQHENLCSIKTIQLPQSLEAMSEVYIFDDLMEANLSSIIRSPQVLTIEHHQFFVYQILRGLKYLHSANILHLNLNPRKIFVNRNCDLKIGGFGNATVKLRNKNLKQPGQPLEIENLVYYAPEVLLDRSAYVKASDIWSMGCILGELMLRRPIFPYQPHLEHIVSLLGTPSDQDLEGGFSPESRRRLSTLPHRMNREFDAVFANCDPAAVDLLGQMLVFNPKKRITAEVALAHPYFAHLHIEEDEPMSEPLSPFDFLFERATASQLKAMFYEEILLYHFPERREEYELRKKEGLSLKDIQGL